MLFDVNILPEASLTLTLTLIHSLFLILCVSLSDSIRQEKSTFSVSCVCGEKMKKSKRWKQQTCTSEKFKGQNGSESEDEKT